MNPRHFLQARGSSTTANAPNKNQSIQTHSLPAGRRMEALHNPKAVAAVQGIQEGQWHGTSQRKDFTRAQLSLLGAAMGCGSSGASIQAFQISGALDSSNEVRPNDASRPPTLQRSSSDPDLLQCPALFQHTRQGEIKAAMGFSHRQKLPPIARTKHPKCRHSIQGHPAEHEPRPPALPVFQHDDQVVPKVQVGLEGTRCLERSAA